MKVIIQRVEVKAVVGIEAVVVVEVAVTVVAATSAVLISVMFSINNLPFTIQLKVLLLLFLLSSLSS